jgi:SAM-dependent methyltransferase
MEPNAYEQFAELERTHFWFRGRRTIFFDLLRQQIGDRRDLKVLEIGCGAGGMLPPLSDFGEVTALDISHETMRYVRSRGYERVLTGSGYELPFPDASFDLVALFDVIEHIPDDKRALDEVRRVLKPGGHVFISVPAYQFLWSQNDRIAHHERRYTATLLRSRLEESGLVRTKVSYFNAFLFPLILPAVLMLKLKERLFGLPKDQTNLSHKFAGPVNDFFAWFMGTERWLLRNIDFPFGHSLIAMAQPAAKTPR